MRQLVQTVGSHNQTSMKGLEECYKHLCFEKVEHKGPMFHGQPMDDTPKTTIKEKSCKLVVRETDDDSLLAHHTLMITLNRPFHPPHQCTLPYTPSTHLMMTHSYHISHSCMLVTHQPHPYILSSPTSMQPSIYPINPLTISYPASTNFSCTRQEWTPVIAKNPNLLKPVFEMQAMLRSVLSWTLTLTLNPAFSTLICNLLSTQMLSPKLVPVSNLRPISFPSTYPINPLSQPTQSSTLAETRRLVRGFWIGNNFEFKRSARAWLWTKSFRVWAPKLRTNLKNVIHKLWWRVKRLPVVKWLLHLRLQVLPLIFSCVSPFVSFPSPFGLSFTVV